MSIQLFPLNRIVFLRAGFVFTGVALLSIFIAAQVFAEGAGPTITPTFTNTIPPTDTPLPSSTPTIEEVILMGTSTPEPEAIVVDDVQKAMPESVNNLPTAQPTSSGRISGTNLFLIIAIVISLIVIMLMVVYGVVQRVRP